MARELERTDWPSNSEKEPLCPPRQAGGDRSYDNKSDHDRELHLYIPAFSCLAHKLTHPSATRSNSNTFWKRHCHAVPIIREDSRVMKLVCVSCNCAIAIG